MCFIYGVKVFLYKDGILYKQFIKDGFKVFSIEKELDTKNLETAFPSTMVPLMVKLEQVALTRKACLMLYMPVLQWRRIYLSNLYLICGTERK